MGSFVKFSVLCALLVSSTVLAGDYPPDYAIHRDSRKNGPVRIERVLQVSGKHVALEIYYFGRLKHKKSLSVNLTVNTFAGPRTHQFEMDNKGNHFYTRVTNGCLVATQVNQCDEYGSDEMKELLAFALTDKTLNQLQTSVEFVSKSGKTDGPFAIKFPLLD